MKNKKEVLPNMINLLLNNFWAKIKMSKTNQRENVCFRHFSFNLDRAVTPITRRPFGRVFHLYTTISLANCLVNCLVDFISSYFNSYI